jgi:glycogen debranching enzyme
MGPFVRAHLRVYDDPEAARRLFAPLLRHLNGHGVGSISEIFDGDAPFTPRGTPAQAWGVAEVLAVWTALHTPGPNGPSGTGQPQTIQENAGPQDAPERASGFQS